MSADERPTKRSKSAKRDEDEPSSSSSGEEEEESIDSGRYSSGSGREVQPVQRLSAVQMRRANWHNAPPKLCVNHTQDTDNLSLENFISYVKRGEDVGFAELVDAVTTALSTRGGGADTEAARELAPAVAKALSGGEEIRLLAGGGQLTAANMTPLLQRQTITMNADRKMLGYVTRLAGWPSPAPTAGAAASPRQTHPHGDDMTLIMSPPPANNKKRTRSSEMRSGEVAVPWRPKIKLPGGLELSPDPVFFFPQAYKNPKAMRVFGDVVVENFVSKYFLWFQDSPPLQLQFRFKGLPGLAEEIEKHRDREEWAMCRVVGTDKRLILIFRLSSRQADPQRPPQYVVDAFFDSQLPEDRFWPWLEQKVIPQRKLVVVLDIDDTLLRTLPRHERLSSERCEAIRLALGDRFESLEYDDKDAGKVVCPLVLAQGVLEKLTKVKDQGEFFIMTAGTHAYAQAVREMFNKRLGATIIRSAYSVRHTERQKRPDLKDLHRFFPLTEAHATQRFVIFDDKREAWRKEEQGLVVPVTNSSTTLDLLSRYEWLQGQLVELRLAQWNQNPLTQSREDALKGDSRRFDEFMEENLTFQALSEMLSKLCGWADPPQRPVAGRKTCQDFLKRWKEIGTTPPFEKLGLRWFVEDDFGGTRRLSVFNELLKDLQKMATKLDKLGDWEPPSTKDWTSDIETKLDLIKQVQASVYHSSQSRRRTVAEALVEERDAREWRPESPSHD